VAVTRQRRVLVVLVAVLTVVSSVPVLGWYYIGRRGALLGTFAIGILAVIVGLIGDATDWGRR